MHAWECENGLQLFSEAAAPVLLLEMSIQSTLSRQSPQSEKVPNPGPLLLTPAPLFLLLGPLHLQCLLQVANQRAGWKMQVVFILCLLQGESQTAQGQSLQSQTRAFQAAETPGGHLHGS